MWLLYKVYTQRNKLIEKFFFWTLYIYKKEYYASLNTFPFFLSIFFIEGLRIKMYSWHNERDPKRASFESNVCRFEPALSIPFALDLFFFLSATKTCLNLHKFFFLIYRILFSFLFIFFYYTIFIVDGYGFHQIYPVYIRFPIYL